MSEPRRATVYLDSDLHRALRMKAAEADRSLSDLVNTAVKRSLLEDAEDLTAFDRGVGVSDHVVAVLRHEYGDVRIVEL